MTMLTTPERLAESVRRRLESSPCAINAYWMRVSEDRDEYAAALNAQLENDPVVVLVVRDSRFTNPNAVAADFVELIGLHQDVCEKRFERRPEKCGFLFLSRSELSVAQISSPVALPTWFPVGGGTTASALIEDLSWTADAPLSADEVRIGELCESLLDLEEALLQRLGYVIAHDSDRRKTMALLDGIRRESGEKLEAILEGAIAERASITTRTAFRPSLRDARSLIARLWGIVQEKSPEQMAAPSKALAGALDLPASFDAHWHESIASVLRRPSGGEGAIPVRFARNVLLTIATACQLVTAAAHADSYERYPMPLLRSLSYDLRRSLADAATAIEMLSS